MVRQIIPIPLLATILLVGCDNQPPLAEIETIRPIKTITLGEPTSSIQLRRFPGLIQAKNATELSFESNGKVTEIHVNTGDQIKGGQVLARLDDETYRLNLKSAEADLKKYQTAYQKISKDYHRQTHSEALYSGLAI